MAFSPSTDLKVDPYLIVIKLLSHSDDLCFAIRLKLAYEQALCLRKG